MPDLQLESAIFFAPVPGSPLGVAALVVALVLAACVLSTWLVLRHLLVECPPNRLAVLSGRPHRLPDGSTVGYRLCSGGRVLRIPILERLDYLDVTSLYVQIRLEHAYLAEGGVSVAVDLAANVRVSTDPGKVRNAVERFLGHPTKEMAEVARQTLEGCAREALAQVNRDQAAGDPEGVARIIAGVAEEQLSRLGLELDMVHVVSIGAEPDTGLSL